MADRTMSRNTEPTIPLVEESLVVDKQPVVTGRVRIATKTETVEEIAALSLAQQAVSVERVVVDREIEQVPPVRTEGDVTIIPVVEEVMVVEKRLILKEELRVTRRTTSERIEVPVTLRKQTAEVERLGPEDPTSGQDPNIEEDDSK